MPYINSDHLLSEIEELKKSPWFNRGNGSGNPVEEDEYYVRKDAVECVVDICIKAEPAADVAPVVHAHWVLVDDYGKPFIDPTYECSICKQLTTTPRSEKFCHNCGAKMDEEAEEDENREDKQ